MTITMLALTCCPISRAGVRRTPLPHRAIRPRPAPARLLFAFATAHLYNAS
jgi:hypothetical protein